MTVAELPDMPPSKIEKTKTDLSQKEVSQSVGSAWGQDEPTEGEKELMDILDACELSSFPPGTAKVFENAIERL